MPGSQTVAGRPDVEPQAASNPRRGRQLVGELTPVVLVIAALLALAVAADLPWSHAVRPLLAVAVTQVLPGALIWRAVRPRHGWWLEDLAMGFAVGSVLAVGVQIAAGLSGATWLGAAIPIAVAVALAAAPTTRRRILEARTSSLPWWFSLLSSLTALAAVPQLLAYFRAVPLTWSSGFRTPHVDAYLHLALSAELAHRGPTTFPWVASEPLAYHWFSHAWVAQVSGTSGIGLDETLFGFMAAWMPLTAAVSVATAAMRLTGRTWAGPAAALLTMAGGNLNVFGQAVQNRAVDPLSPSLGLSVPMLVGLVVVLACRWRGQSRSGAVLLVPVLAIGAAGTKGSTVPLVVAGLGLAIVAALVFDRSRLRVLLLDLALVLACLGFAVVAVFHGSEAGLHLEPLWLRLAADASWLDRALVVIVEFVARLARGAGILLLIGTRRGRRDPLTWLLAGGGLAGTMAVVLLNHPGGSQGYFAVSAIPLLAIGSALGLVTLVERLRGAARGPVIVGLLGGLALALLPSGLIGVLRPRAGIVQQIHLLEIAAVVLVLAGGVALLSTTRRRAGLAGGLVVTVLAAGVTVVGNSLVTVVGNSLLNRGADAGPRKITRNTPRAVSRDQITAARWIRDHSSVDDVIMTNRHCVGTGVPVQCDSRRWVVAAFSERQVLVEGWTATPKATDLAPSGRDSVVISYWKPDLLALNDGFIAHPDAASAARLRDIGVRWVYADATRPRARTLEPFAELRYENKGVAVYELPASG